MQFIHIYRQREWLLIFDENKLFIIYDILAIIGISLKYTISTKNVLLPIIKEDNKASSEFSLGLRNSGSNDTKSIELWMSNFGMSCFGVNGLGMKSFGMGGFGIGVFRISDLRMSGFWMNSLKKSDLKEIDLI